MAGLIIKPLLFIYNLSFSTGMVPDKLKVAKVIPISASVALPMALYKYVYDYDYDYEYTKKGNVLH